MNINFSEVTVTEQLIRQSLYYVQSQYRLDWSSSRGHKKEVFGLHPHEKNIMFSLHVLRRIRTRSSSKLGDKNSFNKIYDEAHERRRSVLLHLTSGHVLNLCPGPKKTIWKKMKHKWVKGSTYLKLVSNLTCSLIHWSKIKAKIIKLATNWNSKPTHLLKKPIMEQPFCNTDSKRVDCTW